MYLVALSPYTPPYGLPLFSSDKMLGWFGVLAPGRTGCAVILRRGVVDWSTIGRPYTPPYGLPLFSSDPMLGCFGAPGRTGCSVILVGGCVSWSTNGRPYTPPYGLTLFSSDPMLGTWPYGMFCDIGGRFFTAYSSDKRLGWSFGNSVHHDALLSRH